MITRWSMLLVSVTTSALLIASTTLADVLQMNGPIISPPNSEIILQSGENYTLLCKGKRPVQFKQQEVPEEKTGFFNMSLRDVISGNNSEYEVALDFYNVDHFAVGYYACFDDTVDSSNVLNNIVEEPVNTPHISYIYIYVNGSNMLAPMRAFIIAKTKSKFLIECRPTTPDINVTLTADKAEIEYDEYSPKIGFIVDSDVLPDAVTNLIYCYFESQVNFTRYEVIVHKHIGDPPPEPLITSEHEYFLGGESFVLNCSVIRRGYNRVAVDLIWSTPDSSSKVTLDSNENETSSNNNLYKCITISNATKEDAGKYSCTSKANGKEITEFKTKKYLAKPLDINMTRAEGQGPGPITSDNLRIMKLSASISSYPPVDHVTFLLNNETLPHLEQKYKTKFTSNSAVISIKQLNVTDTGIYTMVAKNKYKNNSLSFDLRVKGAPRITFSLQKGKRFLIGTDASLVCEAVGYTIPVIKWIFSNENTSPEIIEDHQIDTKESLYKIRSVLKLQVRQSGNITCEASNDFKGSSVTHITEHFLVNEILDGFGIEESDKTWFSEGQKVELICRASIYDFVNVTWDTDEHVDYWESPFSYVAKLVIYPAAPYHSGNYTCRGEIINGTYKEQVISINIEEIQAPEIIDQDVKMDLVELYQQVNLTCDASAVPPPELLWYKDGIPLTPASNDSNVKLFKTPLDYGHISSRVIIEAVKDENLGKYECVVTSKSGTQTKVFDLISKDSKHKAMIFGVIGAIFTMLIILVAYLTWKIRKEKQFRKELADAGLLNFKEGQTKSINPDLGIDEQAELLPYDEKFEFPQEKLQLGKQLGAGAFGVVYKAEARGIINAEESTTVAVKMVKKSADNMYIKALASELKIMVHLGKHINIVNLLGACTKNVGKRELSVIVEYCKFGNIHNYMQKHREVFIDQLTDNAEKNMGKINRGYSCSSGNSGTHSDYFGSNHTQETDNTCLNTANTNRSGRKDNANKQVEFVKVSDTGYLQPEWRSNYESDYSFDGRSPRPLFSRDLLAWAFQIARGMEYLANRKVLHGDLAARNILLAEDNVVKICDFGLARSIYKNDEYQKQENSPLPLKWLAIECMTDRIFSTQSDVWSFGIVLWELFSLAKTPYPNVNPHSLLQWLSEGRRLEKPSYADDRIYDVMKRCWELKPTARPTFGQLQQILGSFLEDNVRNHYVDLNAAYMDINLKREGEEDYLAMVTGPDYNNLVTPSPHHYVNDIRSFFPPTLTQLQHDDEGYLQMSPSTRQNIFNSRPQGNKFDFDPRKLTPRVSEANTHGSESTPMLTLNNLPRSGSESDQEGSSSPYLNMCPRIEEETDEVFETKQNNMKNTQPSAVSNPTYITFSTDDEKKQNNFTNNYINVPNGLVT